ncbi:MAG: alpha/beta hydrolase family protein [Bifidobacteriaceae bacterium]|jgi:hypothetical protein|nr:alpha/beta hydrolase family protein [Bifidobacteriaceae bacterium]
MNVLCWVRRIMIGLGALLLPVGAQLNAWAGERDDLIRSGSPAAPTAHFQMAADGGSLLTADSDPRLRVIVDGDLATADRVAVLVPGVDTGVSQFDGTLTDHFGEPVDWWKTMPGWARSLREAAADLGTGGTLAANVGVSADADADAEGLAVVAWLGYATPRGMAGASAGAMEQGAANLVEFDQFLAAVRPDADVTWICHSYGSLVCASALTAADPDALVLVGSPGVGVSKASQLATTAPIWAGETGRDLISLTRLTAIFGGGFGVLPASDAFGARSLPCGEDDGHSDYFRPGSTQVAAMAAIALGQRG